MPRRHDSQDTSSVRDRLNDLRARIQELVDAVMDKPSQTNDDQRHSNKRS